MQVDHSAQVDVETVSIVLLNKHRTFVVSESISNRVKRTGQNLIYLRNSGAGAND